MSLFETSLEKIARLMAQQWGIKVVFEGTEAKTDGKVITLPAVGELSEEIMQDLNGFLDGQAARAKYTNFAALNKAFSGKGKAFHQQLFKAAEDNRTEKKIIEELPGCEYNIRPLNDKVRNLLKDQWDKLPWPARAVQTIRDALDGKDPEIDEDFKDAYKRIKPVIKDLANAKTTNEVLQRTGEITKRLMEYLDDPGADDPSESDEESEEEGEGDPQPGKGKGKGKGKPDKDGEGESEEGGDPSEGSEEDGDGSEGDGDGEGPEHDKDGKKEAKGDMKKPSKEDMKDASDMMDDDSKWDDLDMTASDYINKEIREEISPGGGKRPKYGRSNKEHVAATTRFDVTEDYTGEGDKAAYMMLKQQVQQHVAPIRRTLEKALKVIENARWRQERERGLLNNRSLSKLVAEPGYRKPFKELTKEAVNDVAIQILIDMSGSMAGRMDTAKSTAIVLAEALKELDISFEVTGFYSAHSPKAIAWARDAKIDMSQYNRCTEALHTCIFKSFDSYNLTGISKLYVGQQNPDGEAVRWAAKRLSQQKQKRKILFVLSDGAPATGEGHFDILHRDLKLSVENIVKHGIEVVGIGIQTDCVKEFYPDYVVVNRIDELPKEAMTKLSKLILKGVTK